MSPFTGRFLSLQLLGSEGLLPVCCSLASVLATFCSMTVSGRLGVLCARVDHSCTAETSRSKYPSNIRGQLGSSLVGFRVEANADGVLSPSFKV